MGITITDQELTEFIRRAEEAATAYVQGAVDRYLDLLHHADGFTLMRPYGGPASSLSRQVARADRFDAPRVELNTADHAWQNESRAASDRVFQPEVDAVWETALPLTEAGNHRLSHWLGRPGLSPRLHTPGPGPRRQDHHSTAP